MKQFNGIGQVTGTIAGLCIACVSGAAFAQDGLTVLLDVAPDADPSAISVSDCATVGPDLSGTALILSCAPGDIYEVTDADGPRYGHIQLRDGVGVADLSPHPLYRLIAGAQTREEAGEALAALDPALRPLDAAEVSAPLEPELVAEPAPVAAENMVATFLWPQAYGTLQLASGQLIEIARQEGGLFYGRALLNGTEGVVTVASNLNPECAVEIAYPGEAEELAVTLPCESRAVSLPYAGVFSGLGCTTNSDTTLSCLVPSGAEMIRLQGNGWAPIELALSADGPSLVDAAMMVPDVDLAGLMNSGDMGGNCGIAPPLVEFTGYCSALGCVDLAGGAVELGAGQAMPSLAASGWTDPTLPLGYRLRVMRDGVAEEQDFGLDVAAADALVPWLRARMESGTFPLNMSLENTQYALGRQARFYSDASCETSLGGQFVDLSNPGNRTPDLPQCSYFQVADRGKIRSDCVPVAFDSAAQRVTATLPPEPCGPERVVVMISEYSTLNGAAGQAIIEGIRDLTQDMREADSCVTVDIARSIAEDREVIFAAEDIYFAGSEAELDGALRMDFVSRSMDVLRDFEWVYRIWGEDLAGIILVADGAQVRPNNMIDSPAAMAWKLNNVMTQAITFDPAQSCDAFEQVLLFDGCVAGDTNTFEDQLTDAVDQALATIRGTR